MLTSLPKIKMAGGFAVLVFTLLFGSISASGGVPILIWTNQDALSLEPVSAGKVIKQQEFNQYISPVISKKTNTVLFVQDKLSLEDFTHYGAVYDDSEMSAFQNVKYMLARYESSHLPAVQAPVQAIQHIKQEYNAGNTIELKAPYDIPDVEEEKLYVVRLPDIGADVKESLQRNDDIIKKVMEKLDVTKKTFTALFTGLKQSKKQSQRKEVYSGRHLLEANSTSNDLINVTGCIFMFAESLNLTVIEYDEDRGKWIIPKTSDNNSITLKPSDFTTDGSSCKNSQLILKNNGTDNIKNIVITMDFMLGNKTQTWTTNMTISYMFNSTDVTRVMNAKQIYGPDTFSYHCTDTKIMSVTDSANHTQGFLTTILTINNFQIQPYSIKNAKFGRPNDCQGFFTIPLLSALFVSLILTVVLVFGISMISSIVTQDKFDDPKGKTISVPLGD